MKTAAAILLAASVLTTDDWAVSKGGAFVRDASGKVVEAAMRLSWITDSDLQVLGALPDLQRIDLSHTRVTDLGFGALKPLRHVAALNLYYAEQTGDGALAAIKDWRELRSLNLRGTKVTDAGLAHLAGMTRLESLDIGFALITDGGFDRLTPLTGLKSLSVGGNKITDAGLSGLRLLPQLTSLDVSGKQRTDSGLWSASVTDQGLDNIAALTALESLNLRGTNISDAGMPKLTALASLRELQLGQTQISAKGLADLPKLRKLERLSLFEAARMDDAAVDALAACPNLAWLDVQGTKLTTSARERLHQLKPKCRIVGAQP